MEIAPNSIIYLCNDVPLDSTYDDSIAFASAAAQESYFSGKAKRTFTAQSYARVSDGVVRLEVNPNDIYDCNYMMFRNTSYGTKWFYAFINDIRYINNGRADIQFTLDVLQTWLFDMDLGVAFVERMHTASDNAGDNLQPEPVTLGEIQTYNIQASGWFNNYHVVVQTAEQNS